MLPMQDRFKVNSPIIWLHHGRDGRHGRGRRRRRGRRRPPQAGLSLLVRVGVGVAHDAEAEEVLGDGADGETQGEGEQTGR